MTADMKDYKDVTDWRRCKNCGRTGGHISKYGIHLCRQCFREYATEIGFKKYS